MGNLKLPFEAGKVAHSAGRFRLDTLLHLLDVKLEHAATIYLGIDMRSLEFLTLICRNKSTQALKLGLEEVTEENFKQHCQEVAKTFWEICDSFSSVSLEMFKACWCFEAGPLEDSFSKSLFKKEAVNPIPKLTKTINNRLKSRRRQVCKLLNDYFTEDAKHHGNDDYLLENLCRQVSFPAEAIIMIAKEMEQLVTSKGAKHLVQVVKDGFEADVQLNIWACNVKRARKDEKIALIALTRDLDFLISCSGWDGMVDITQRCNRVWRSQDLMTNSRHGSSNSIALWKRKLIMVWCHLAGGSDNFISCGIVSSNFAEDGLTILKNNKLLPDLFDFALETFKNSQDNIDFKEIVELLHTFLEEYGTNASLDKMHSFYPSLDELANKFTVLAGLVGTGVMSYVSMNNCKETLKDIPRFSDYPIKRFIAKALEEATKLPGGIDELQRQARLLQANTMETNWNNFINSANTSLVNKDYIGKRVTVTVRAKREEPISMSRLERLEKQKEERLKRAMNHVVFSYNHRETKFLTIDCREPVDESG